jgi:hypothetical protein
MFHWLHHLLNPHCPQCQMEAIDRKVCASCEVLSQQLAIANIEKKQMLETILSFSKPAENQSSPPVDYEKLKPRMMTWNVRKQMLEAEDRKAAQVLAEQRKAAEAAKENPRTESIEQLEREVGISEEVKPGA